MAQYEMMTDWNIASRTTVRIFCVCALLFGSRTFAVSELYGFRMESTDGARMENGSSIVFAEKDLDVRLFGRDFTPATVLSFTPKPAERGEDCSDLRTTDIFPVRLVTPYVAVVTIKLPLLLGDDEDGVFYFCLREAVNGSARMTTDDNVGGTAEKTSFVHQGTDRWAQLKTEPAKTTLMPIWLQICVVIILLTFSGLFSGLNLGLMSLDQTELSIMENSGTPREKRYAKMIRPVRKRGNFLLCTILLGNVLVNNTLAILLDDLTGSGMAAIIGATLGIVVFGEIIPQAFCSRYGLAVGARTIWFTKFFMVLTFPLSYPISRLLDCILGEEIGYVYNRDRLRELLRLTEKQMDLKKDEMNIIAGALELSKKTVGSVMTKLDDIFMIEYNSILDFDTMSLIMKTGYTRIPVYEKERTNIVALLNIKDLAFIDPDDRTPLQTVCKFYNHPVNFIFDDTRLDIVLEDFKKGKSHMAVVQTINDKGPGDPFYETVGLVTLEDVIEEIIQSEIIDETDTVTDNRVRAPRKSHVKDFSIFNQPDDHNYPRLSPQLALATFQYLSTTVLPFKSDFISENILQRLIKQNVIVNFRLVEPSAPECYLYRSGKPCDYFIMILQGRVQVEFGKETLVFEGGPFVYFGVQALVLPQTLLKQSSMTSMNSLTDAINTAQQSPQTPYIPDYTVRATTDLQYLRIRRAHYIVALRATLLERRQRQQQPDGVQGTPSTLADEEDDAFAKEWKRAQTAIASSPVDGTRSDVGSMRDDSSARDVALGQPSFDGVNSDAGNQIDLYSNRTSPADHNAVSVSFDASGDNVDIPLLESSSLVRRTLNGATKDSTS